MANDDFGQWYPHLIDKWLASASIAALSDAGYRAVHNLLMYQWQQADGMLPEGIDDRGLAKHARISSRWSKVKDEVVEFFPVAPNGRRFNVRNHLEWKRASELHCVRKENARVANDTRWSGRRKKDQPADSISSQGDIFNPSGIRDGSVTDAERMRDGYVTDPPNHTLPNHTKHNTTQVAEKPVPDVSQVALRIACAHPKSRLKALKPIEVGSFEQRSVVNAIVAEASASQSSIETAAEYILAVVEQIAKDTPADQVRYVPDVAKFFDNREYRKPTNSWSGRNGANNGRSGTNTERTISGLADFLGADAVSKVDSDTARGARDGTADDAREAGLPAIHGGAIRVREGGHHRGGKGIVIDAAL